MCLEDKAVSVVFGSLVGVICEGSGMGFRVFFFCFELWFGLRREGLFEGRFRF